jgi:hypothetical protein
VHDDQPPGGDDVAPGHPPDERHDAADEHEREDEDRDDGVHPRVLRPEHPEPEATGGRDEHDEDRRTHQAPRVRPQPRDDAFWRGLGGHGVMHTAGG